MSSAKITLLGMFNFMEAQDSSLFSGFSLPSGIDDELAVNQILARGGEFEVIYSNPLLMQNQIGFWCRKWERTFKKWIDALNIEYDPLYNYDRHEEWEDERHNKQDGKDTNDLTSTNDLTTTNDLKTATNTNATTETERSAFDSSEYQPLTKETITGDEDDNYTKDTGTIKNTGTVKNTGDVKRENKEDETSKHKGHLYGNIGVTTSQQMLEAELEIAKWNIYEHIADIFLSEFTIPLYT